MTFLPLAAETITTKEYLPIPVTGYIGNVAELTASVDYTNSYAFDMTDTRVAADAAISNKTGMRIGSWSLTSNGTNVVVKVSHDKLKYEMEEGNTDYHVDYSLAVQSSNDANYHFLTSGDEHAVSISFPSSSVVSFLNNGLFVRLAEDPATHSPELPGGFYVSTIHFELTSEE